MTNARSAFIVVLLVLLSSCFEPVDVGSNDAGADAGTDGGALVCTLGQDQTCNELESMSALAGTCGASGCVCRSGFEQGPTGRCRPPNSCPPGPQQPGQACQLPGVTCRYGYEPLECGGRTVRCEGVSWVEVEHTDPQVSCGGLALTWHPTMLDFGRTPVGQRATLEVTFFNPNLRVVELSGLSVREGASPSTVFTVVAANPGDLTRLTVPAGRRDASSGVVTPGSARATLQFQPPASGPRSSTLEARTVLAAQALLSVALRGEGAPAADGGSSLCYALCGFAGTCSSTVQTEKNAGQCPPGFADATACTVSACLPPPGPCVFGRLGGCNDDMAVMPVLGTCTVLNQCECVPGAEVNPATGLCRPSPLDGGTPLCTGSGNDQACNESLVMSSFAGQCIGGRCFCISGFEPSPSGRCQMRGSVCTDRVAMSCNDGPADGGVGGVAGQCVLGQCVCGAGFEVNPRTGRCTASRAPSTCTVGQDQTCNGDVSMSGLAGQCMAGRCTCNPGFALASDGRCVASNSGYCVQNSGTGLCSFSTLDGGTAFSTAGQCGTLPLSPGCTCGAGSSPGVGMAFCAGACPPMAGTTCVTTNCGMVNCLPPTRCIGENRCEVP